MCHTHVHHHRPLLEVLKEVTALGVALSARHEPCRTGGTLEWAAAAAPGGGGGVGAGGGAMAGVAVASAALSAAAY